MNHSLAMYDARVKHKVLALIRSICQLPSPAAHYQSLVILRYKFLVRHTFLLICPPFSDNGTGVAGEVVRPWQACLPLHLASTIPLFWLHFRTSPAVLSSSPQVMEMVVCRRVFPAVGGCGHQASRWQSELMHHRRQWITPMGLGSQSSIGERTF